MPHTASNIGLGHSGRHPHSGTDGTAVHCGGACGVPSWCRSRFAETVHAMVGRPRPRRLTTSCRTAVIGHCLQIRATCRACATHAIVVKPWRRIRRFSADRTASAPAKPDVGLGAGARQHTQAIPSLGPEAPGDLKISPLSRDAPCPHRREKNSPPENLGIQNPQNSGSGNPKIMGPGSQKTGASALEIMGFGEKSGERRWRRWPENAGRWMSICR